MSRIEELRALHEAATDGASIDRAVKAAAEGDVVAMLRALKDLQEYSE